MASHGFLGSLKEAFAKLISKATDERGNTRWLNRNEGRMLCIGQPSAAGA
jgi:hypothetical protein